MTDNQIVKVFNFEEKDQIRVQVGENGEPLFCASDVAKALGYTDKDQAIRKNCKDPSKRRIVLPNGSKSWQNFISEPDLYRLIFSSKLPSAQRFETWVVSDVLPSIRKTGGYGQRVEVKTLEVPTDFISALDVIKDLEYERQRLVAVNRETESKFQKSEAEIDKMKPYADYGEALADSTGARLIGVFAKMLCIDGRAIGPFKLFQYLREKKILMSLSGDRKNLPMQYYINRGYFVVTPQRFPHPTRKGETKSAHTTKITPKGELWLVQKMKDDPAFYGHSILIKDRQEAFPYMGPTLDLFN